MKDLIIDLSKKHMYPIYETVVLYELKNSMAYVDRTKKVDVYTVIITKELENHLFIWHMKEYQVNLYYRDFLYTTPEAINNLIGTIRANQVASYAEQELRYRTSKLIVDNKIPHEVVADIDAHLPLEELTRWDITIGQQVLPIIKQTTYKPTDLQRKEWGVSDPDFVFNKEREQVKSVYQVTLYDKLVAWLQLQYYYTLITVAEPPQDGIIFPVSNCDCPKYEMDLSMPYMDKQLEHERVVAITNPDYCTPNGYRYKL